MAGRELEAVGRAVDRYVAGENVTQAATAEGISTATLHRALKRRKIERRGPPAGEQHHAWKHGRKARSASA